ncbi:hypothetical protein D3C87_2070470 [compost metagenome]
MTAATDDASLALDHLIGPAQGLILQKPDKPLPLAHVKEARRIAVEQGQAPGHVLGAISAGKDHSPSCHAALA